MRLLVRITVSAAVLVAAITIFELGSSSAQIPDEFKNLKVLPKDISKRELTGIMRGFAGALGVRCAECHESTQPGSTRLEDLDFASDKKEEKEAARKMMRMVGSINEQIGKMGFENPVQVRCVTCHHGVKHPETLAAVLQREMDKNGVEAAIARYRELRDEYYGSGAYDFSPEVLPELGGSLAESKKDFAGAVKLLQLNLEFSPKHADTHATLGRVYLAKGDRAAAIASFEKTLEIEPNHRWAKQQLERAKSGQ
jgi:tetratricopeptide (TPR) repeat protein